MKHHESHQIRHVQPLAIAWTFFRMMGKGIRRESKGLQPQFECCGLQPLGNL